MPDHIAGDETMMPERSVDAATLQAENDTLRDRMLRALADAENTRRQADRAQRDARQFAIANFARDLLPVIDNLQRTIAAAEERARGSGDDVALIEGVQAIERLLLHTFERFGIERMEALGEPFDPSRHEAMAEEDGGSQPPGAIMRVMEEGYTLHDRLLRPARVAVASRRSPEPASAQADASPAEPALHSDEAR
jgi:molecular chaperone GrpE